MEYSHHVLSLGAVPEKHLVSVLVPRAYFLTLFSALDREDVAYQTLDFEIEILDSRFNVASTR